MDQGEQFISSDKSLFRNKEF